MGYEEECNHVWITNSGAGGPPDYRANQQPEPKMHVICRECRARTWFTEKQWWNLPSGTKSERHVHA